MVGLTIQIIALGLGLVISPGLFAGTIFLLSSKVKPVSKSLAFLLGNIITLIILLLIGYSVGTFVNGSGSSTARYFDIGFGLLLLWFAYSAYRYKPREDSEIKKENNNPRLLLWMGIGFLGSVTNLDAETIYLISMNEIFESGSSFVKEILLVLYSSIMILLPILLPLVCYFLFPEKSKRILEKLNLFLKRYGQGMMVVLFLMLGAWFLIKGFGG